MRNRKTLYLVFSDNSNLVRGLEKIRKCGFEQIFNIPIQSLGQESALKTHTLIKTFTEQQWKPYEGGIILQEYLDVMDNPSWTD